MIFGDYPALGGLAKYRHKDKRGDGSGGTGGADTQSIEGFWSLIKQGIMGSFHKVSKKYPPLYVAEFQFRYKH